MDNRKSNILRLIFWGLITICLFSAAIVGSIYNNRIFNSRKDDLEKIIMIFENSKIIKNYHSIDTRINAELEGKNIKITYDGADVKEYVFKLKDGYLETNINQNDSIGKIIVMVITDAIAINKGRNEESTYIVFNNNKMLDYKLEEGIEYKKIKDTFNVKINLDTYLNVPY